MKVFAAVFMVSAALLSPLSHAQKEINLGEYSNVETGYRGNKAETIAKIKKMTSGKKQRVQVILAPFTSSASYEEIDGGVSATSAMKAMIRDGGNIEIIDRNIPESIMSELIAIEQGGISQGQSFSLAQYAIRGEVLEMSQGATWTDAKTVVRDDKPYTTPALCTLSGSARVNIRIYNMNPLELMESFVVSGHGSSTTESSRSCSGISDNGKSVEAAISKAVADKKNMIKNMFSPAGMVSGHMAKKNKHIFRTTLTPSEVRADGAKLSLKFYKHVSVKDQITGAERILKSEIGTGKVRIARDTGEVWAQVNKKTAADILIGDIVSVLAVCPLTDLSCQIDRFGK